MRFSKLFGKTLREAPSEAESISHQLLLRAGMTAQEAAGIYSYLPLGWRALRKIESIIREEMDGVGGQELSLPVLQPFEIWAKSGRDASFGKSLFTLTEGAAIDNCCGQPVSNTLTLRQKEHPWQRKRYPEKNS